MDKVKNIDELSFKEDYNHCDHIVANAALLLGSLLFWFLIRTIGVFFESLLPLLVIIRQLTAALCYKIPSS